MLSLPVVLLVIAPWPLAVLSLPAVLKYRALRRPDPVVLSCSASAPMAVLTKPVVLLANVLTPTAVFEVCVGRRGKVTVHVNDHIRSRGTGIIDADPA